MSNTATWSTEAFFTPRSRSRIVETFQTHRSRRYHTVGFSLRSSQGSAQEACLHHPTGRSSVKHGSAIFQRIAAEHLSLNRPSMGFLNNGGLATCFFRYVKPWERPRARARWRPKAQARRQEGRTRTPGVSVRSAVVGSWNGSVHIVAGMGRVPGRTHRS